ncbi:MAG: transglutaminase family protein [Vitreoscilla sp.]|nr:transglutaminase family protein [Polaromonas sp.]
MLLSLTHETNYRYTPAVENADHVLHLSPASCARQTVIDHRLDISPQPSHLRSSIDVYGNRCSFFSLQGSHEQLSVTAHSRVQTHASPPSPVCHVAWERAREMFRYRAGAPYNTAWEFLFASPYVPRDAAFAEFARDSFAPGVSLLDAAGDLMTRIHNAMAYDGDSTDVNTPALAALQQGKGVCQDFAHIMVACCRAMGLPARYVSGYMLTQPAPGQPRLIGCDASHAWASVYCPGIDGQNGEWFDFDPTNNRVPGEDYITLATGRDFLDVSPLRGVIRGGAQHALRVAVTVMPLEAMLDTV